jgi:hypothetical protein
MFHLTREQFTEIQSILMEASMQSYRQGDILIRPCFSWDLSRAKPTRSKIVAKGEKTGHHHTLEGSAGLLVAGVKKYITVSGPAKMTHPEHGEIAIAPGSYEVIRQRELGANEKYRSVRD